MSHMKRPRIHFFGIFFTDPSTINNNPDNYDPSRTLDPSWSPNGLHYFELRSCRVTRALHRSGVATSSGSDQLVGGTIDMPRRHTTAKIVDLDPRYQSGSEIFGGQLRVRVGGNDVISGTMRTAALRDLWFGRVPSRSHVPAAGGAFYTVIDNPSIGSLARSPTLAAFRGQRHLTLKLVVYAFTTNNSKGKVLGTIGIGDPPVDSGFAGRRLFAFTSGGRAHDQVGAFGSADAELDTSRSTLTLDIGNAIPEASVGGSRINLGQLRAYAEVPSAAAGAPSRVALGAVDYSTARFESTAGVEELQLNASQVAAARTGTLLLEDTHASRTIVTENPSGLAAIVDKPVFRLQPGTTAVARVHVRRRGQPASGVQLLVAAVPRGGSRAGGLVRPTATPSAITTGGSGMATLSLRAARPTPGPGDFMDGEVYEIGVYTGAAAPANRVASTFVRVFDDFTAPASPTWSDVRPILQQFQRLYPGMGNRVAPFVPGHDLGDHQTYRNPTYRTLARTYLLHPLDDPRHMPVTRDLSEAKRRMIIAWLDAGAP